MSDLTDAPNVDRAQLAALGRHKPGFYAGAYRLGVRCQAIRYLGYNMQEVFAVFRGAMGVAVSWTFADSYILRGGGSRVELRPGSWLVITEAGVAIALSDTVFNALREEK